MSPSSSTSTIASATATSRRDLTAECPHTVDEVGIGQLIEDGTRGSNSLVLAAEQIVERTREQVVLADELDSLHG